MKTPLYLLLLLTLLTFQNSLSAQNTEKQHEIGLRFSNLDNFGAIYKFGNERTLYRLSLLQGYVQDLKTEYSSSSESKVKAHGFGLALGFEKPLPVNDQFAFYWGCELGGTYGNSKQSGSLVSETTTKNTRLDFDFVLGCKYKASERIRIGAELLPGFYYSKVDGTENSQNNKSFGFGLSNQSAAITVSYCF